MVKVESQDTLWLLTVRFMKMNCRRNQIAILAIILTTVLFTSLFTGAVSMTLSKLEADKKTYHSWSHVILQDITQAEAQNVSEVLQKNNSVERFGVNIFVGTLKDERILFQTEVRSVDADAAEAFCNAEMRGRLPENKNEIALSSLVLDALSISYETIANQKFLLRFYWIMQVQRKNGSHKTSISVAGGKVTFRITVNTHGFQMRLRRRLYLKFHAQIWKMVQ